MDELYFGEIGFHVVSTVRAVDWAFGRACPLAGETDFHPVLEDETVITPMWISGAPEVLPAVRKSAGIRELRIHPGKRIRDFLTFRSKVKE